MTEVDEAYPLRITNERNALFYKKKDDEKQILVSIGLTSGKATPAFHPIENETLIDFKLIEGALMYMLVNPDDNFYKFYIRNLRRGQPSYEFHNSFPGKRNLLSQLRYEEL